MADITVTPADVDIGDGSGNFDAAPMGFDGTAGSGAAGLLVYKDNDGLLQKCDAADATKRRFSGMLLDSVAAAATARYVPSGPVVIAASGTPMTPWTWYVMGSTGFFMPVGDLASGDKVIYIGYSDATGRVLNIKSLLTGVEIA